METEDFLSWVSVSKDGVTSFNWSVGIPLFIVGIIGALVFIYISYGDALPGMGGAGRLEAMHNSIARVEQQKAEIWQSRTADQGLSQEQKFRLDFLCAEQERLERAAAKLEKTRALLGIPMYAILGGVFASALATNLLLALVIGFGWTGLIHALGLSRKAEQLASEKDRVKERSELGIRSATDAYRQDLETLTQNLDVARAKLEDRKAIARELTKQLQNRAEATAIPGNGEALDEVVRSMTQALVSQVRAQFASPPTPQTHSQGQPK